MDHLDAEGFAPDSLIAGARQTPPTSLKSTVASSVNISTAREKQRSSITLVQSHINCCSSEESAGSIMVLFPVFRSGVAHVGMARGKRVRGRP